MLPESGDCAYSLFLYTFHRVEGFPFSKKLRSYCFIKEKTVPIGNFKEKHSCDGILSLKLKPGMFLNVSVTLFLQRLKRNKNGNSSCVW